MPFAYKYFYHRQLSRLCGIPIQNTHVFLALEHCDVNISMLVDQRITKSILTSYPGLIGRVLTQCSCIHAAFGRLRMRRTFSTRSRCSLLHDTLQVQRRRYANTSHMAQPTVPLYLANGTGQDIGTVVLYTLKHHYLTKYSYLYTEKISVMSQKKSLVVTSTCI